MRHTRDREHEPLEEPNVRVRDAEGTTSSYELASADTQLVTSLFLEARGAYS